MVFNPLDPFGSLLSWLADRAIDGWREASRWALTAGGIDDTGWQIAQNTLNRMAGVMGFVAVAAGLAGVIVQAVRGNTGGMLVAFFKAVLAWPLTVITVTLVVKVIPLVDGLTSNILGGEKLAEDTNVNLAIFTSQYNAVIVLIMALLTAVGSIILMMMMAARTLLLILGFGLAPAALMLGAAGWTKQLPARWLSFMSGVILIQPVAALMISIASSLMSAAGPRSPMSWALAPVACFLAAFLPWKIPSLIAQLLPGGEHINLGMQAGGEMVRATENAAKNAGKTVAGVATGGAGALPGMSEAHDIAGLFGGGDTEQESTSQDTPETQSSTTPDTSSADASQQAFNTSEQGSSVETGAADSNAKDPYDDPYVWPGSNDEPPEYEYDPYGPDYDYGQPAQPDRGDSSTFTGGGEQRGSNQSSTGGQPMPATSQPEAGESRDVDVDVNVHTDTPTTSASGNAGSASGASSSGGASSSTGGSSSGDDQSVWAD